jgi:hypothetical protein
MIPSTHSLTPPSPSSTNAPTSKPSSTQIGHQYGNFHQYYTFHSSKDRLQMIPEQFFTKLWMTLNMPNVIALLDIGK